VQKVELNRTTLVLYNVKGRVWQPECQRPITRLIYRTERRVPSDVSPCNCTSAKTTARRQDLSNLDGILRDIRENGMGAIGQTGRKVKFGRQKR